MNIIYLVHEFPEDGGAGGGAGNYVFNMSQIMVEKGHNVKVIVESNRNEVRKENGIEVHRIGVEKGFSNISGHMKTYQKALKNIWRSIFYNAEVRKICQKEKIDIVQSVDAYAIALLRCKKIPYIVRFSGYSPFWAGAMQPVFDKKQWMKSKRMDFRLWRWAYKRADVLIAPSNMVKGLIEAESKRNVTVVESPVCIREQKKVEHEYDITKGQYWVTFGRMTYRKSITVLAEIIDDLLEAYPSMKYVMIGKDEKILYKDVSMNVSDMFKLNIKRHYDRFVYTGKISDRNLLFQIIKDSYACILPTRIDNLPNSILEAMALGKIVLSSDKTSAEQLITDGYNGFLSEIDNAEDLYQKIEIIMGLSSEERKRIEIRAQERVKALSAENVYKNMMHIYKETIMDFKMKNKITD